MAIPETSIDLARRFGGIARLYGTAALDRFQAAHVAVVGVGGVGSWAVEALARSGIGELTLIDLDHVAESNINRQLPALEQTLGRAKIAVLGERVAGINSLCRLHLVEAFVEAGNLPSRRSAEPINQEERARILEQVRREGFSRGYRGVRISSAGRRFTIQNAIVWNLVDAAGEYLGQAATFDRWTFLD